MKNFLTLSVSLFLTATIVYADNQDDNSLKLFGLQIDKNGYFEVPKENKDSLFIQREDKLIKLYEQQQKDFLKKQNKKLKDMFK